MTEVATPTDWPDRYQHVDRVLTRSGPFTDESFTPGKESQDFLRNKCKILVIGESMYFTWRLPGERLEDGTTANWMLI